MSDAPIFANSLAYVRGKRHLSIEDVAKEIGTSVSRLKRMEAGEVVPTERQFSAFEAIYGVPDYSLAAVGKPKIDAVAVDLRQRASGPLRVSPRALRVLFSKLSLTRVIDGIATSMQMSSVKSRPAGFNVSNIGSRAAAVNGLLKFNPNEQRWIDNPDKALRYLRARIELYGIYCLMVDVPPSDFRGLFTSISDSAFLILINKKTFKPKARLFTLAHEFAHFLIGVEGVSDPLIINNEVEEACNKFASRFLLSSAKLQEGLTEARSKSDKIDFWVKWISNKSLLSQGAVAFRLRDEGAIDHKQYVKWFKRNGLPPDFAGDPADDLDGTEASGGNWAYNVVSDWGFRPLEILERARSQAVIDDVHVGAIINARGETQDLAFATAETRKAELGI